MDACIERGPPIAGALPGGLNVRPRAWRIEQALLSERGANPVHPHVANDRLSV